MKKEASQPRQKGVSYIRVSTKRQGRSGLGLAAQRRSIRFFFGERNMKLIKEFKEVETAKRFHRPILEKALKYCKDNNAELIIATLDRLSRKVLFVALLMESNVKFTATDNPTADTYTTYINAARAQDESERISKRTKQALQVAKSRGVKLGTYGKVLAKKNHRASEKFTLKMKPIILSLHKQGFDTVQSITDELNRRKIHTYRQGCHWHLSTVHKILSILKVNRLNYFKTIELK